jgi:hypothetical protein
MTTINRVSNCSDLIKPVITTVACGLSAWFGGAYGLIAAAGVYTAYKIFHSSAEQPNSILASKVKVLQSLENKAVGGNDSADEKKPAIAETDVKSTQTHTTSTVTVKDTETEEKKAASIEEKKGASDWEIRTEVKADGNCLYHSVALLLQTSSKGISHDEIRATVASWMSANLDKDNELKKYVLESMLNDIEAEIKKQEEEYKSNGAILQETGAFTELGYAALLEKYPNGAIPDHIDLTKIGSELYSKTAESKLKEMEKKKQAIFSSLYGQAQADKGLMRAYIDKVGTLGSFGSSAELYAISQIYGVRVVVKKEGLPGYDRTFGSGKTFVIEHNRKGDHYTPVIFLKDLDSL